ncbi:MAG: homoserine O-acetyltransferase [Armatimonadetes bacterium]|nr:MAG: homoserine O-acetyltransferase [Armatimonadota bacterium]
MSIEEGLFQENERTKPHADARSYLDVGSLTCELGGSLPQVTVAYETWGELNADRSNAVLVFHAVSSDSHAVGWWDRIVGPGKPIDTERYFVICSNCLGACQGTTGPITAAGDGRPYGMRFPQITLGDTVEVARRLVESLGIGRLHAACGGSMGGMQAVEMSLRFPGSVQKVWATAACAAHSAMQIGFNEAARQAVMRDPKWRGGEYPADDPPVEGLAVARMIGHLSFLSRESFERKFGRQVQEGVGDVSFLPQFQVESYLNYQGSQFTKRFDANSFLYLTRAMNLFERRSFAGTQSEYLFTCFASDWLYPPSQSRELHELARAAGAPSQVVELDSPWGHDSFLLDAEHQGGAAQEFLRS